MYTETMTNLEFFGIMAVLNQTRVEKRGGNVCIDLEILNSDIGRMDVGEGEGLLVVILTGALRSRPCFGRGVHRGYNAEEGGCKAI